ncbi:MAG: hypothetical protein IPG58_14620 [Acidobacteria bacterium]|nr:hypothetical protein [Acidobacteriota bacterium]
MVLTSPGGVASLVTVSRIGVTTAGSFGDSSNYSGAYVFSDAAASTNIWTLATAGGCGDLCNIAADTYRTTGAGQTGQTNPPPVTSLMTAFSGLSTAQLNGTWTLTIRDAANVDTGTTTAANLTLTGTAACGTPTPTSTPTAAPTATPACTPTQLYTNGPLVTHPGGGFGGADASALQDGAPISNTIFGFGHAASTGFRVADNFTVPAGGWTINTATFYAYQTGSTTTSTINAVNVRIWDGVPGAVGSNIVFGDTTTNRLASSTFANDYRVLLSAGLLGTTRPIMANVVNIGTTLPAGTYWFDWQTGGTLGSGPWAPAVTILGQQGKPGADGRQMDASMVWSAALDVVPQDFPFLITGIGTCATPTPSSTPTPLADLAIVKTDNVSVVTTPGTTTYTLTVTNAGPAPAVNAIVTDNFPAGVIVDNWTCLPQNEALCTLDGAGNINEAVYIPVGGILTYTANVSIAAGQTGTLVNTATVTAPPTVIDPNLANNTSTDTDTYGMSISGNVQQFVQGGPNTNLAGVLITAQPGGATATTNASGNFTIAGVPGTTYTLTPTMAGKVFDPVSRVVTSTANVTGVNFIAYNSPGGIPRNIFVVNSHATPGNPVTVPIRMTSQGTEKVMTFSIDYPLEKLFSPVVTCGASTPGCAVASTNVTPGKLGITITAAGAGVAAGLREIANVTFQTNIGFAPPNAALTFSTTPTAQSVRDAANNELQKTFTNGFVVFVDGVESDVAGRNTGNGTVASTDVVQVRRFVANLDQVDPAFNEFQRADAAPLATRGDGALLPGDVVQARRYAASLDGAQAAAGPAGPPLPALGTGAEPVEERPDVVTDREFRLTTERADRGQNIGLGVEYSPKG